ncbi:unnamed protein product, partial [Onchocerca ochengi]|uniref:Glutamine synthetase n=1 Tax=Onchocerca ochengi TaxID=42157 RepID=A0A182EZ93_ONCOC
MVGVVKRTLQRVGKNLLEEGEFTALITEVEFLVNERPLVDYERDREQVFCPGDFLWPGYNDAKNSLEYENNLHEKEKMGRVKKLIDGKEGRCRSAVVRMSNGIRLTRAIG